LSSFDIGIRIIICLSVAFDLATTTDFEKHWLFLLFQNTDLIFSF
jgi:hypothetical protein